ncbi:MAG: GntR family transcriptional regulator, partial [Clostridia bacterium]|nr:GntR family transcriptional regulator [Clostridia bacterium]
MQGNNEPTSRDYLYDKIADILENDIVSGSFGTEKLPSEQNLAGKYNVSRTVIREALKILGERHLIFSMAGSGAFITKPDAFDLSFPLNMGAAVVFLILEKMEHRVDPFRLTTDA